MRRFLSLLLVFSFIFIPQSYPMGMAAGKSIAMSKARDPQLAKYPDIRKMPDGLTFYADYTGRYQELNAAYSIGSPVATFTNTSGNVPVFTADGISIGTARDDVLQYEVAGNRTAAQETIIIKFKPDSDFANDGVRRYLTATDTKERCIYKTTTASVLSFQPNATDSASCNVVFTTTNLANTSYVVASVAYGETVATNGEGYTNGVSEKTDTDNYTANVGWTDTYIGSNLSGALQLNGSIGKVAFFNRGLTTTEIAQVSTLMGYD